MYSFIIGIHSYEYNQEEEENELSLEFMKPVPFLNETTEPP